MFYLIKKETGEKVEFSTEAGALATLEAFPKKYELDGDKPKAKKAKAIVEEVPVIEEVPAAENIED